jgi:DNA topoisomerase IB
VEFGRALPRLVATCAPICGSPGLPREKVLATLVSLLESTLIRVGNEEYARRNRSYGLGTDQRRFPSQSIFFRFVIVEPMPRKKEPTLRFPTIAP